MKKYILIFISLSFFTFSYGEDKTSTNRRLAWWDYDRFGMFIHWGLYAIPGGIWNGREVDGLGEWIMAYADIPVKEYEKLAKQFNPINFDARQWAQLAKDAGMKYLIITTRHHDGFCLFNTKATDWDVIDSTPFKRDIVKELKEACDEAGIKFGVYYSILEWHHRAMELNTDYKDLEPFSDQAIEGGALTNIDTTWRKYGQVRVEKDKKEEFINYMKFQLKELIQNYDPAIIWFDGGWVDWWTPEDGKQLLNYLWNINPELIFNNRAGEDFENDTWYGDYGTPEQTIPLQGLNFRWESCMTMNSTWGYKLNDHNWKSSRLLITQLVDITAKGGNFLLNVGPKPDGNFPEESIDRLKQISNWMKINGEFVYGTKVWKTYKEGAHEMREEYYDTPDLNSVKLPFTAADIRFSTKGNVVYAACLDWPDTELKIETLGKKSSRDIIVANVEMLGSPEELYWQQNDDALTVSVPEQKPGEYVFVYKIIMEEL